MLPKQILLKEYPTADGVVNVGFIEVLGPFEIVGAVRPFFSKGSEGVQRILVKFAAWRAIKSRGCPMGALRA